MIDIPDGHAGLTIRVARDGRVWVNDGLRCILRAGRPAAGAHVLVTDGRPDSLVTNGRLDPRAILAPRSDQE